MWHKAILTQQKFRLNEVEDQYEFDKVIGNGTHGKVYRAIHKHSKAVYAIKSAKQKHVERTINEKYVDEISILKLCLATECPNALPFVEYFQNE